MHPLFRDSLTDRSTLHIQMFMLHPKATSDIIQDIIQDTMSRLGGKLTWKCGKCTTPKELEEHMQTSRSKVPLLH